MKFSLKRFAVWVAACWLSAAMAWGATPGQVAGRAYLLPSYAATVAQPVMSLNGTWDFRYSSQSKWTSLQVPGEVAMQGYAIRHDSPFFYRRKVNVPADYAGQQMILRFDGVYSHAKLYVNGHMVREHHGGFTRWETDVTAWLRPGKKNEISLEVEDRLDDVSYASGYAHHPIGGILRDVTLFALPVSHLFDVQVETHLDSLYRDAELKLAGSLAGPVEAEILVRLTDPSGKPVDQIPQSFVWQPGENVLTIPVKNPLKWDAEHPHLYTLEVSVLHGQKQLYRFERHIGFREVEIQKNRMLVNGRPVKLRGACRHDIHPTLGRTTTAAIDSLDVQLFKQANMNFVRTSHYPPSERFLEFCNRYGIYVECESAACFVDTYRQKNYAPGNSQDDPAFADRYVGQCQEMVKSFRSHPSVLFWSIGNESRYGKNFQLCYDWVKQTDTTRPVIFSYPGSALEHKALIYDILSMHYQDVNGNLDQWGMSTRGFQGHGLPTLYDEWAHPACYTYATLQTDPNIREFWGQSIDRMWRGLFEAPGGLGGAIWGFVDEVFALPEPKVGSAFWKEFAHTAKPADFQGKCVGYGEWGIVDVWRRPKPEFWSTKKAYSPVRLEVDDCLPFTPGQPLTLTIRNRFDHTCLDEIQAFYTFKGQRKEVRLEPVEPHQKGLMILPAETWEKGEPLYIEFCTPDGELIDAYRPYLGERMVTYPKSSLQAVPLQILDEPDRLVVKGGNFQIPFDKTSGLIVNATVGSQEIIEKGPFLHAYINLNHLTGAEVRRMADHFTLSEEDWKKTALRAVKDEQGNVRVMLEGTYRDVQVAFSLRITPNGELSMDYHTKGIPNGYLRETGLTFHLAPALEKLEWKRNGYWNCYPENDFAGNEGAADLYASEQAAYGEAPVQPWSDDTHDYYYWADAGANCKHPLTQKAKGMKENIFYYALSTAQSEAHGLVCISPEALLACRLQKIDDERLVLHVNNRWDYPEIAWGNYCKTLEALPCYGQVNLYLK